MELICFNCSNKFKRNQSEHNRSVQLNRKEFCSHSCQFKYLHKLGKYDKNKDNFTKIYSIQGVGRKNDEFSSFRKFYRSIKSRSKFKNWKVEITLQDLKNQWDKQQGKCYYTGIDLLLPINTCKKSEIINPRLCSLERLDSTKSYLPDNIVFCCFMANCTKNQFTKEEMFDFCKLVVKHNNL